jgi:peptidoglycan-associated lipoprotein
MHLRLFVVAMVFAGLAVSACRREAPEPPPPPPAEESGPDMDSLRAWEDSVERAREAREREAREAEARRRAIADARAILEQRVHFEFDRSRITPDAEAVLRQKLPILRNSPDVRIRLEGHTDERGSVEYNQALGMRRAQSVLDWLIENGVTQARFQTTSFGEERPLVNRSDEEAWAQNRRVEFIITAGADRINPNRD